MILGKHAAYRPLLVDPNHGHTIIKIGMSDLKEYSHYYKTESQTQDSEKIVDLVKHPESFVAVLEFLATSDFSLSPKHISHLNLTQLLTGNNHINSAELFEAALWATRVNCLQNT